jgi:hypothetical protein
MSKRDSNWNVSLDMLVLLGPFLVLPCVAILASLPLAIIAQLKTGDLFALYRLGLGTGALSVILLFIARLPLYRKRRFWAVGPGNLDPKHRRIYWLAYILLAATVMVLGAIRLRAA